MAACAYLGRDFTSATLSTAGDTCADILGGDWDEPVWTLFHAVAIEQEPNNAHIASIGVIAI